jgi:hypothetical protein
MEFPGLPFFQFVELGIPFSEGNVAGIIFSAKVLFRVDFGGVAPIGFCIFCFIFSLRCTELFTRVGALWGERFVCATPVFAIGPPFASMACWHSHAGSHSKTLPIRQTVVSIVAKKNNFNYQLCIILEFASKTCTL